MDVPMDHQDRRWLKLSIAACVAVVYLYPLTLGTPLLDPDEGLHASIAQEMVESGDYLVPRFCGEPFRDKPIVYFAAQAASLRLLGMNEAAVRLPGVLFSLLGCFTTWLLARRLYDKEIARYALAAALTLVLPVMLTQSPAHDIALVPAINLLALCFWEQDRAATARMRWSWLAGGAACVAFALLTKGLIGIAVFAVGIGLYAIFTRSLSWRLVGSSAFVLGAGGALASPWFLAMETASPGYLQYYFIERHLMGFVTEAQSHGEAPWYYYLAPVLGGAMPWLLYSVAAVVQLAFDGKQGKESRATVWMACWFVGGFLFLSTANSKLMTYSLPLFPPLAVLAGVAICRFFRGSLAPAMAMAVANTFRIACVVGIFAPVITLLVFDDFLGAPSPAAADLLAVVAGVVIAAALAIFQLGDRRTGFAVGILWFPILFAALIRGPFPVFAEFHSQRALAREISNYETLPQRVVMIGEETGSFLFYLSPEEREWFRDGRVVEANGRTIDRLASLPPEWIVAITDKELDRTLHADEVRRRSPAMAGSFRIIESAIPGVAERPTREGTSRW
jgi:4-amino-4-deoxy-L-arabinose transferase-like glycosyltransferase